jgi:hypothetical protein
MAFLFPLSHQPLFLQDFFYAHHRFYAYCSIYIWSKNVSHSAYEKSEAKMAAIDVQSL